MPINSIFITDLPVYLTLVLDNNYLYSIHAPGNTDTYMDDRFVHYRLLTPLGYMASFGSTTFFIYLKNYLLLDNCKSFKNSTGKDIICRLCVSTMNRYRSYITNILGDVHFWCT